MYNFFLILFSITTVFSHYTASAKNLGNTQTAIQTPQYEVIDLSADTFSDNRLLYISGKIKNTSFHPIKGYIIVRLQDAENTNIGFIETAVNKSLPIDHYRMGAFNITVNIEKESHIRNVSIEFVDTNK